MYLARFPRVFLAHLATPLEPMERLSKELGVEIWIKRDDCTGMSTGGNKTRKLEFLMAEALDQGAEKTLKSIEKQTLFLIFVILGKVEKNNNSFWS